ncbi:alpha/beta fold hydrolase [Lacisediminihabitans changchengi]|uniref:Alpha/beta hydrolase n=1 Tax=Lacisediminihabitans changchengi TaxID=2787634 RepID=A0A934W1W4_9MICO|nr:alpha/beta hydrolase [Lacisediminihabitans changchengi]MBK4347298.1 alpha/beta hydrolase [Lacisediminihabitans changchengi]
MTEQSILERNGAAVPYVEEGSGPISLVFISGRPLDSDGLSAVSHYLASEAGFHVTRIGPRNEATVSAHERADDALAVIDHLGLRHTWVGGYGSGGTVARVFVAAHPERANGLVLLGVEDEQIPLAPVMPVVIVQGADDVVTPTANGEALRATAPERATITTINGATHQFPMSHPIETAVVIEEYLDWD